jgi:hypothetical protein
MNKLYEVQTKFHGGTWDNCWTNDDGTLVTYPSHAAACESIREHIADCNQAVLDGDMIDAPSRSDFRIVEIETI